MKLLSTLTIAALLTAGSAFAATTPTATAGATATPAAPVAKKMGHCEKEAKAKNLAGDAADAFVKECKATHAKKTN